MSDLLDGDDSYMTRADFKDVGFSAVASVKYVDGRGQICQCLCEGT